MRTAAKIFAVLVCLLLARGAHANNCSVTAASIAFGTYNSTAPLSGVGTFSITCNKPANVLIQLAPGTGTYSQRQMTATPAGSLNYNLYTDNSYGTIWGDGNNNGSGSVTVNVPGSGTYFVYGFVNAGQISPIGSYADTLAVTITYDSGNGTKVTSPNTLAVTANVTAICTISANALAFGSLGALALQSANWDQTTTVSSTCSTGTAPTYIGLSQGLNPAGGSTDPAPQRRMKSGVNYLTYQLYWDPARTQVWGNTLTSGYTGPFTANGTPQSLTVYGRVPSPQTPAAGSYADTVTVTINF